MIESGKYVLRNGRIVYYDEYQPRQIALLVKDRLVEYGRTYDIEARNELFGAEKVDYGVGDVIRLAPPYISVSKSGAYIITDICAPFTVSVARLVDKWKAPTIHIPWMLELRYFVALSQRPYLPYPYVPTCPKCYAQGLRVDASPLFLKSLPDGGDLYTCERCRFNQLVSIDREKETS